MTSDLEQRLVALGATLELPPAPDLVPAVLSRLPARRRPHRTGRTLAVALATLLLLAGGAMALAPTRHAILRVLGLRGVRIERVPRLPAPNQPPQPSAGLKLGLGRRIPLARARHATSFTALVPPGEPAAYVGRDLPGGRISLLLGRVLIIEFRGTTVPYIFKVLGPGTRLQHVRVNGRSGFYLSGAPHQVLFQTLTGNIQTDRVRLAGNVLMWQQGPLTIRIEGTRNLAQARALAGSLR
jgi:hypothetical protein